MPECHADANWGEPEPIKAPFMLGRAIMAGRVLNQRDKRPDQGSDMAGMAY